MLVRCSRSSMRNVLKAVHGKPVDVPRLQTLLKALLIAFLLILTVGVLIRLFVGLSERTARLRMPLFLRSDTDIWSANLPHRHHPEWRPWLAQSGIHVSAIVFYGRRDFVRVLDPYLKRNLVSAGGLLEEVSRASSNAETRIRTSKKHLRNCPQVVWVVRTDDKQDLEWLEHTLLPSEPSYHKVVPTGMLRTCCQWCTI